MEVLFLFSQGIQTVLNCLSLIHSLAQKNTTWAPGYQAWCANVSPLGLGLRTLAGQPKPRELWLPPAWETGPEESDKQKMAPFWKHPDCRTILKKQFWPWERCVIWDSPEVTPTPLISETLGKAGRLSSASGPNIQVFPKHFWFRDSTALQTQPRPSLYHLSPVTPQLSLTHPHSCLANWSGCLCPCKIHMLKPILGHSLSLMSDGL